MARSVASSMLALVALLRVPELGAASCSGEACAEVDEDTQSLLQAYAQNRKRNEDQEGDDNTTTSAPLVVGGGAAVPPGQCKVRPGVFVVLTGGRSGKYCRDAGDNIFCDSDTVTPLTKFEVVDAGDGRMAFKGPKLKAMCADEGPRIVCNRPWVRLWEWYTVRDYPGAVTLQGNRDRSFCTDAAGGVRCNVTSEGQNEKFGIQCVDKVPDCSFTLTYAMAPGDSVNVQTKVYSDHFDIQFCVDEGCKDWALNFKVQTANKVIARTSRLGGTVGEEETSGGWPASLVAEQPAHFTFTWTAAKWEVSINGARTPAFDFVHRAKTQPALVRVVCTPDCNANFWIARATTTTSTTTARATTTTTRATTTTTRITTTTTTTTATAKPCVMKPGTIVVFQGGRSGKYCRDEGTRVVCDSDKITDLEKFLVHDAGNGHMAIAGSKLGLMCANEIGTIKCDRPWNKLWEWLCVNQYDDYVTLQGVRNKLFCSDIEGGIQCGAEVANKPEKFRLLCVDKFCGGGLDPPLNQTA